MKNDRYAVTPGDKVVLQVNAGQSRHLHIGDKARCVVNLLGFKKFVGRGKRGNAVAESAHETLCPLRTTSSSSTTTIIGVFGKSEYP